MEYNLGAAWVEIWNRATEQEVDDYAAKQLATLMNQLGSNGFKRVLEKAEDIYKVTEAIAKG